jgi:hypothetical protein
MVNLVGTFLITPANILALVMPDLGITELAVAFCNILRDEPFDCR